MKNSFCHLMEQNYRDKPLFELKKQLPQEIHYPLYVHLINAFGYRDEWAKPLLKYICFNGQNQPYFPIAPITPEDHRHKFLFTLCLSEQSPQSWKIQDREILSQDFIAAILASPLDDWGDHSLFPEASWTLQFLSAHCDEAGRWQDRPTPMAEVTQKSMIRYLQDYQSKDLYQKGKTIFTESGLHFLEALNKLIKNQGEMILPAEGTLLKEFFPQFKQHLLARLAESAKITQTLIHIPDWQEEPEATQWISLAIEQILVSGHLLEACFHPHGALTQAWQAKELTWLKAESESLAQLMLSFFDLKTLALLNAEQQKAYHFPLFHAYHALKLGEVV